MHELLVCSHRGPVSYTASTAGVQLKPAGVGGLVVGVAAAIERLGGTWVFASASAREAELAQLAPGGIEQEGVNYQPLGLPRAAHQDHYATISSELLMPLFLRMLPTSGQPVFTERARRAWDGYRLVNSIYAEAIRFRDCAAVLVEDLHLMLVAAAVRRHGPGRLADVPLSYFHHVPWCSADYFGQLPAQIRLEILRGLLAFDSVGFHCRRWAEAFWACCERYVPGVGRTGDIITRQGHQTRLVASPVAVDAGRLARMADSPVALEWRRRFREGTGARKLIVRVERADPAKNTVRGLHAYAKLLDRRPQLAEETCLLAVLTRNRTWIPAYRRYLDQCFRTAAVINRRFPSAPVFLHLGEDAEDRDQHRALGALAIASTVMATSVYDGFNLVAMEAMMVGAAPSLVLSQNTGAQARLGPHAFVVNPFDISGTSGAIERSIDEAAPQRIARVTALREIIAAHTPSDWIRDRLAGLG